jgi:hypothetical protein
MSSKEWRQVVDRLMTEAARRGGEAIEDPDMVTLRPPQDSGELVRVLRYTDESGTDQTVFIETGFAYRLPVSLNGEDGAEDVFTTIVAILDGHATEVAEISVDGVWLNTACTVDRPGEGVQRRTIIAPAWHLKGASVDHEHVRQIDPWPPPTSSVS